MTAHTLAEKLAKFRRLGLAHLPTPLEPMKRLTAHLGGPRLWVKREDATGLGFGGNKLRKLDYVLHAGDLERRRHDRLGRRRAIEQPAAGRGGGGQARPRLPSRRLPRPARTADAGVRDVRQRVPQPPVRRALSTTCRGPATATPPFAALVERSRGRAASLTSCPTASRTRWARSAMPRRSSRSTQAAQCAGFTPAIVHCTGSAGTQAGLVVGARLAMPARASSASISTPSPARARRRRGLRRDAADLLDGRFDDGSVEVVAGHAGPGLRRRRMKPPRSDPARRRAGGAGPSIRSIPARVSPA